MDPPEQPNSFLTQIPQYKEEKAEESPLEESPQKIPEEQDPRSLKKLLTTFNGYDKEERGLITLQHVAAILAPLNLPTERVPQYHGMSLPLYDNQCSFDELLFVLGLSEFESGRESKEQLLRRVDPRLIEFLKQLLNRYRKKAEKGGNYKQAKNSKTKIEQIRGREMNRRNKYLKILYEREVFQAEQTQKAKFQQFCSRWDLFMNQYESTATDLLKKVRDRQQVELAEFEARTREELGAKMHFSKYLLELQHREKNLVKLQEYERAREAQREIEQMRTRQIREKELADEETLELKLRGLRKQQEGAVSTLLQKIQKDRNEHLRQRQSETERLLVRGKSQMTQIDHRYNETLKRIYEAVTNLGLESKGK